MTSIKSDVINDVIDVEGGYVNDPSDSGGETKYGITKSVAIASGYHGDMKRLPREVAFDIYVNRYWNSLSGDLLLPISESVAIEVVDSGINMGVGRSASFLQRALNALNYNQRFYPDLTVDRKIGPVTANALSKYVSRRGEIVMVRALNCLQGAFYIELAERREKDERFLYGWLKNRVST